MSCDLDFCQKGIPEVTLWLIAGAGGTFREEGDEAGSEVFQRISAPWKHLYPVNRPFHVVSSAWNLGVNSHSVVLISGKSLTIYLHNCWWTQLGIMMSCIKMKRNRRPYRETKKEQAVLFHTADPSWSKKDDYFFCILTMETKLINHRPEVLKKIHYIGIPSLSKKLKNFNRFFSLIPKAKERWVLMSWKKQNVSFKRNSVSVSLQFQEDWNKEMGNEKM